MTADVSVLIPAIPPRIELLGRALESVRAQTIQPRATLVKMDNEGVRPAQIRNSLIQAADTEWVAFLDDDDEFKPEHLQRLLETAEETGADVVYPWFDQPENGWDGLGAFGIPFSELAHELANRNWIPVTLLVRREAILDSGGFQYPWEGATDCEDWGAWRALYAAGARFHHLPERTWIWHHWGGNTSGAKWNAAPN